TPLEHPPYSFDLSSCDFHMFGPPKEALGGERFNNDAAVEYYVRNRLFERPSTFFDEGVKKLLARWRKCISVEGN
ncbi:Histone-lysine N-methyltransferase SETMAR, partial [Harpegnathos saltator]